MVEPKVKGGEVFLSERNELRNHMVKRADTGRGEELGLLAKSPITAGRGAGDLMSLLLARARESGVLLAAQLLPSHVTSEKTAALPGCHFSHLYNRANQAPTPGSS